MSDSDSENKTWAEVWEEAGQELDFLPPIPEVREAAIRGFFAFMLFF
jgi:hypothetical protein